MSADDTLEERSVAASEVKAGLALDNGHPTRLYVSGLHGRPAGADEALQAADDGDGGADGGQGKRGPHEPWLEHPRWAVPEVFHGDEVEMLVDVHNHPGGEVAFTVERLDGETWTQLAELAVAEANGRARARVPVLHPRHEGDDAAEAESPDPRNLRFRARLGAAATTGRPGSADDAEGAEEAEAIDPSAPRLTHPRWVDADVFHGEDAEMMVEVANHDGGRVAFVVERLDGEAWSTLAEVTAQVVDGEARGRVPAEHPRHVGGTTDEAQEPHPRNLRFRARPL